MVGNALWVKCLRSKYVRLNNFLEEPYYDGSWCGKESKRKNWISKGICYIIGDGLKIRALRDPWLPNV